MKKVRERITLSLSSITVLSVTAAALVAVIVCVAVFAGVYSRALKRDAVYSAEQTTAQTAMAVDNYINSMQEKLSLIKEIAESDNGSADISEALSNIVYIQSDIYCVTVYGENGEILSCTGNGTLKENVYSDNSFDKELFSSGDKIFISAPHVQTLFQNEYPWVVTLGTKTSTTAFENGRYIAIDFNFTEIAKYINNIGVGSQGYCFIADREGNIVYHPQQQLLFSGIKAENTEILTSLKDGTHTESDIIYSLKEVNNKKWRIISVTYTDYMQTERRTQVLKSFGITMLCSAVILFAVFAVYSRLVNAPVKHLIREMKRFETEAEAFTLNYGNETVSELKVISDSFEHMTERIKKLMAQVLDEQTELRKTELKALQAQINPHFLYNTLDSIQWMCERGNTADAAKMVSALARLFRISISRGRELITIREEIQHAENYLLIQSYRYKEQFTYSFEVDPELSECLCNKITIQPLIENAIYHGLDRHIDEGKITVTVRADEDNSGDILITVSDNGIGMTEEQCEAILKKQRSDSSGIGVKNVNDRLKIYFGEQYGLSIKSELDVGTEVIVRIPRLKGDNNAT